MHLHITVATLAFWSSSASVSLAEQRCTASGSDEKGMQKGTGTFFDILFRQPENLGNSYCLAAKSKVHLENKR